MALKIPTLEIYNVATLMQETNQGATYNTCRYSYIYIDVDRYRYRCKYRWRG